MKPILITGTDTGVGKSVVACAVIRALRASGVKAIGFKPAETGLDGSGPADSQRLREASGRDEPLAAPLLALREPLAPAMAAERLGVAFDPAESRHRVEGLTGLGYTVVIEGAGGLLVPFAWDYTVLSLAAEVSARAIVVARAGLGTLNHVRLTVDALDARGIPILGVVLNGIHEPPDLAEETNPVALQRLLPQVKLVVLPQRADVESAESTAAFDAALAPLLDSPRGESIA